MFEPDAAIQREMRRTREQFETNKSLMAQAVLFHAKDKEGTPVTAQTVALVAMPDMSDPEQRFHLQNMAIELDGYFICVSNEMWCASADPRDEEGLELIAEASEAGTLHLLPPKYRSEEVRFAAEGTDMPIQMWSAKITRDDETVTLGPWVKLDITMPRPEFRRYLPERRDGKIVIKVPFPRTR